MKVLGCFKIVPDLDLVAEEDWVADDQFHVNTEYVKLQWNCFDESALELMLTLSDLSKALDVVYDLNALTIGKKQHEPFLKTLYALGYQHITRVQAEEEIPFCPEQIASIIGAYIKGKSSQDVVIMGTASSEGNNRKTPLILAENLKWPCITQVIGIGPVDERHLKVISQTEDGTLKRVVKVPCVLSVGNAPGTFLRVPTLAARLRLGTQPIELLAAEELLNGYQGESVRLEALTGLDETRDTVVITGSTPQEKAQRLYDLYLKGRLKSL